MKALSYFWKYFAEFFLEWKCFQIKATEKIKTHFLCPITSFWKSCCCEITSKNMVEPERQQTIQLMRVAYWITKATRASTAREPPKHTHTHTHTQKYVIIIACLQYQWFSERNWMLRYTYIALYVIRTLRYTLYVHCVFFKEYPAPVFTVYFIRMCICTLRTQSVVPPPPPRKDCTLLDCTVWNSAHHNNHLPRHNILKCHSDFILVPSSESSHPSSILYNMHFIPGNRFSHTGQLCFPGNQHNNIFAKFKVVLTIWP
jgi:hypothetical protein